MNMPCRDRFCVTTCLSSAQVINTLNAFVHTRPSFWRWGDPMGKPFCGTVGPARFCISPVVSYRNSFVPVLTGTIGGGGDCTLITVDMGLAAPVRVFLGIWLALCAGPFLAAAAQWPVRGFRPVDLIPLGMLAFGFGLAALGWYLEAGKAKKRFLGLFPPA